MKKVIKISMVLVVLFLFQSIMVVNVSASQKGTQRVSQQGLNSAKPITIDITNNPGKMSAGSSIVLNTSIYPSSASGDTLTWSSSDNKIATVDKNGKVTAKKDGTVKITVTTSNGKNAVVAITVKSPSSGSSNSSSSKSNGKKTVAVTDIKITGSKEVMLLNGNTTLKAEVLPSNASNKKISWSSSDKNIATVDSNGKVIAKKVGVVNITATASNGVKKSVTINVADVQFDKKNIKVSKDSSYDLTATVTVPGSYAKIMNTQYGWKKGNSNLISLDYDKNPSISGINDTLTAKYSVKINGKEEGMTMLDFSIFGVNSADYTLVNVIEEGADDSIPCPEITYDTSSPDNIVFKITPNSKIAKYKIQRSTNGKTGGAAKWSAVSNEYKGEASITYPYSFAQAKITVYSDTGSSRVCYTAPFNVHDWRNIRTNSSLPCPKISAKVTKNNGATSYDLNRYNTMPMHTGIASANISISSTSGLQYTWFENLNNNQDYWAEWGNAVTLEGSTNKTLKTSTETYYDRQGLILVMNKYGDVKYCYTDIYNPINFEKKVDINGVNVYFEKGFSRIDYLTEFLKKVPLEYTVATANIFYLKEDTYDKNVGGGQGVAFYGNIVERDGAGDYGRNSVIHEMGHNLDQMYGSVYKKTEDGVTSEGNLIRDYDDVKNLYSTLISKKGTGTGTCDGYSYLRGYSYQDHYQAEFWADVVKYTYVDNYYKNDSTDKCSVNRDIYSIKNDYLDNIIEQKNEFIKIRNKYK